MPAHGRIIRPRQLFPEIIAVWIQLRRGLLRVVWSIGRIDLWFPPWVTAAATGTAAIMLAILLFFLRSPYVAASQDTSRTEVQNPTPAAQFVSIPVPAPTLPALAPSLSAKLVRTKLDELWDQYQMVTVTSRPQWPQEPWQALAHRKIDDWKIAIPCRDHAVEFTSYLLRGSQVPYSPPVITTSNVPHPDVTARINRQAGLTIEKRVPPQAVNSGAPFSYDIVIRNPTGHRIDGVVVRELLNAVQRVVSVAPVASVQGDELVWSLGSVSPQEERTLSVTVVPVVESAIDTQAMLTAVTQFASSSTFVRQSIVPMVLDIAEPPLPINPMPPADEPVVQAEPPPVPAAEPFVEQEPRQPILKLTASKVHALRTGDNLQVVYKVTNVGTAAAENVNILVRLPEQLRHRHGAYVKHSIPRLKPGESHQTVLRAAAEIAGQTTFKTELALGGEIQHRQSTPVKITQRPPAAVPASPCPVMSEQSYAGYPGFLPESPMEFQVFRPFTPLLAAYDFQ